GAARPREGRARPPALWTRHHRSVVGPPFLLIGRLAAGGGGGEGDGGARGLGRALVRRHGGDGGRRRRGDREAGELEAFVGIGEIGRGRDVGGVWGGGGGGGGSAREGGGRGE